MAANTPRDGGSDDWHQLSGLDLRLLLYLTVLVEEAHVSRAAARLGISQPTLSLALNKLRTIFSDRLLVRGKRAMYPTPYALEIVSHYRDMIAAMQRTMAVHAQFDPASSDRVFRILAYDYVTFALGADLIGEVRRVAPKVSIEIMPVVGPDPRDMLERGAVDMAIGYYSQLDSELRVSKLRSRNAVCIVNAATLRPGEPFTLKDFLNRPHLCLAIAPGRFTSYTEMQIDTLLGGLRQQRRRQVSVSSPLSMPAIVAASDMIAIVAEDLAETAQQVYPIEIIRIPEIQFSIDLFLVWHERHEAEPAHQWMRNLVRQIAVGTRAGKRRHASR